MHVDHTEFFAKLVSKGEDAVKIDYAKGNVYAGTNANLVHEWLQSKERSRSEAASSKRDDREEETILIAKAALSEARSANVAATEANRIASSVRDSVSLQARWAMYAAIIAATAAIIAAKDQIVSLVISWLP